MICPKHNWFRQSRSCKETSRCPNILPISRQTGELGFISINNKPLLPSAPRPSSNWEKRFAIISLQSVSWVKRISGQQMMYALVLLVFFFFGFGFWTHQQYLGWLSDKRSIEAATLCPFQRARNHQKQPHDHQKQPHDHHWAPRDNGEYIVELCGHRRSVDDRPWGNFQFNASQVPPYNRAGGTSGFVESICVATKRGGNPFWESRATKSWKPRQSSLQIPKSTPEKQQIYPCSVFAPSGHHSHSSLRKHGVGWHSNDDRSGKGSRNCLPAPGARTMHFLCLPC